MVLYHGSDEKETIFIKTCLSWWCLFKVVIICLLQEKKLVTYQNLLQTMEKGDVNDSMLEHCPTLSKAMIENTKLKYRVQILQAVTNTTHLGCAFL